MEDTNKINRLFVWDGEEIINGYAKANSQENNDGRKTKKCEK